MGLQAVLHAIYPPQCLGWRSRGGVATGRGNGPALPAAPVPATKVRIGYSGGATGETSAMGSEPPACWAAKSVAPFAAATRPRVWQGRAGRHALALQNRGLEVTALEQSEISVKVMQQRGVKNVVCDDVFHFNEKGFDTIIILMNGAGIGQTLKGAKKLLLHLKTLLNPHGQMLMDSSDIRYLFEEDDGSMWIDMASKTYLGEMEYEVTYKDSFSRFKWLFIDYDTLSDIAREAGLVPDLITQGEHYDYLARLTFPD